MKDKRGEMGKVTIIAMIIILVVILIALSFFIFFYTKTAKDKKEFNDALFNCERAKFLNDGESAIWFYTIQGKEGENCLVNVKLISVKKGIIDTKRLEGEDMTCKLPMGYIGNPESELRRCSGLLKEGMQDIIIEKMHSYITSNIEQIGKEFIGFNGSLG